jgi:sphingomyelin phosphodiesterase
VYPILGNHGCFPANNYLFGQETWLTDFLADEWGRWLTPEAVAQIKKTGSYSMLHPNSNLKVIIMNT